MRDQAIELMKAGRYEEAFERFDKLLSRSRTDWSLFYMAGQCARFSNDLPKAAYLLQRSAALNPNEPQVYLALGIALQLTNQLSESVEAFRRAIELDGDLVSAYNSLAITQKRIGQLDLARHNLEEALKALGRCIAKDLRNERVTPIAPHPTTAGDHWTQVAIDAAMFLYARSSNISKMAWPTGQQAVEEARTRRHGGLFWEDKIDSQGNPTRFFLPNFFNTVFGILRSGDIYANILGNLGSVLGLLGDQEQSDTHISEANEFLGRRGTD